MDVQLNYNMWTYGRLQYKNRRLGFLGLSFFVLVRFSVLFMLRLTAYFMQINFSIKKAIASVIGGRLR